MEIYPAIDILGGRVVRLLRGRYDEVTVYAEDPAAEAARLRGAARRLHVVDLEGARAGQPVQLEIVRRVAAAFGEGVQVGGGVRSIASVEAYFELGVSRVVLGTAAIKDPEMVREAARRFPGRVVVAIDAKDGMVAVAGWEETSSARATDLAKELSGLDLAAILYTDVARDGTRVGPNVEATRELAVASAPVAVLASGGVGSLDDLRALAGTAGISGAIVGRALYDGAFTLSDARDAAGDR